ncbi:hypothetical protein Sjap_002306 [Stephania japonica]|uniref:VOC domain-containing protein n=1 Tax=Stephania japonica TaxID=461633 RepID=A0AAP0PVZ9_9MAGN
MNWKPNLAQFLILPNNKLMSGMTTDGAKVQRLTSGIGIAMALSLLYHCTVAAFPRSPTSSARQIRRPELVGRSRIQPIQSPKTPEPQSLSVKKETPMLTPLDLSFSYQTQIPSYTASTNRNGSKIKKSLQTIGKLINPSEKKNHKSTTTPIVARSFHTNGTFSDINEGSAPLTANARTTRRKSLIGIQNSGVSRRSSLGGKSTDNPLSKIKDPSSGQSVEQACNKAMVLESLLFNYGIGIHLVEANNENKQQLPADTAHLDPMDNHVSFQCEDMGAVERKLKQLSVRHIKRTVGAAAAADDDGGDDSSGGSAIDQLFFNDPDGYMIEMCNCENLKLVPAGSAGQIKLPFDRHNPPIKTNGRLESCDR